MSSKLLVKFFAEIKLIDAQVSENLKRILKTRPGERPNRLDFGVGVQIFQFSNMSRVSQTMIENIKNQIEIYEPRIILEDINVEQIAEHNIRTTIKYRIREDYLTPRELTVE